MYRAVEQKEGGLESEVALKVLRTGLDPAGQALHRLRDEARLLARLNHPTLLKVFDLVVLNERVSLVAEYINGQDLQQCIQVAPRIPMRPTLEVVARVAGALHQAWAGRVVGMDTPLRIVHRDIKPSNIRISRHGDVKLLDFGIARTDAVAREASTRTDLMMGSPVYMAPERFSSKEAHPGSDVFGLGCTLFEALVGSRLFGGLSVIQMSAMSIDVERFTTFVEERLADIPQQVPADVVNVIRASVRFDPDERPSAYDMMQACEVLADQVRGPTLSRWCKGRQWPETVGKKGPLSGQFLLETGLCESGDVVAQAFASVEDVQRPLSQRTTAQAKRPAKQTHGDPTLVSAAQTAPRASSEQPPMGLPMPMNVAMLVVGLGLGLTALYLVW